MVGIVNEIKEKIQDINKPKVQREVEAEMDRINYQLLKLKGFPGFQEYIALLEEVAQDINSRWTSVTTIDQLHYLQGQSSVMDAILHSTEMMGEELRPEFIAEDEESE